LEAAGGGEAWADEAGVGEGRGGISVCVGGGVSVNVAVAGGDGVNVGRDVSTAPDGWNGVGVEDAFGSCVTKMKGAKA